MRKSQWICAVVAMAGCLPLGARADETLDGRHPSEPYFIITAQSCVFCPETAMYEFRLEFSDAPDFWTVDQYDRTAHGFWYDIWYDNTPYNYNTFKVRLGSSQINTTDLVLVQDRDGFPEGPNGWGPVRGAVAYVLDGRAMTFSIPADVIGDPDGQISYRLVTGEYGSSSRVYPSLRARHSTVDEDCDGGTPTVETTWGAVKAIYGEGGGL